MSKEKEWATTERMIEVLNNALDCIGEIYHGEELYNTLTGSFGMTDDEIRAAGFRCVPDDE